MLFFYLLVINWFFFVVGGEIVYMMRRGWVELYFRDLCFRCCVVLFFGLVFGGFFRVLSIFLLFIVLFFLYFIVMF